MKANIVITLEGQVQIITQEGSFEAGQAKIAALLAALQAQGLEISLDGPVEQHRHGPNDNLHAHTHAGGHHAG